MSDNDIANNESGESEAKQASCGNQNNKLKDAKKLPLFHIYGFIWPTVNMKALIWTLKYKRVKKNSYYHLWDFVDSWLNGDETPVIFLFSLWFILIHLTCYKKNGGGPTTLNHS